ncbi:hypothetical protein SAMN05216321_109103 [Cupriavidus sp. OV038]|jgi:hypothetical protein|uniref:hypothetical protein n=1 Tax=unclassified Cupriavidus TaxID=2640874 RepID=UPI0008E297C9|nr:MULTISPECIES: hypothetical protein [unclassified Cupriavidus]SFC98233.1 hypothetical protein SAMN05216321_109103 [Cupriavidus sp. OV038]SFP63233.1 hypothetical protein SAMN05216322_10899 [Cupriavidus sp. OV096]
MNAKTILSAAALAAAFVTGAAQAAPASNQTGEAYGYGYRVNDARSPYSDGARDVHRPRNPFVDGARVNDQRSPFSDGARAGKFDPYTDGTHTVAGRDRTGVSAEPGRADDSAVETA